MKNSEITLIIADDHPLFRSGVRKELETESRYSIIGETGNGAEALGMIQKLHPRIAILDFEMPELNGLEIAARLSGQKDIRIILLTMHSDKKIFHKAMDLGIHGYVLKDDAVIDIVKAVDAVASGRHFISETLSRFLVEKAGTQKTEHEKTLRINELTTTEKKVLNLVADLKTNDEIADMLFISKRTVENHKVNITSKLGLKSSRQLLKFALENKTLLK